jgi:hypothetical protein
MFCAIAWLPPRSAAGGPRRTAARPRERFARVDGIQIANAPVKVRDGDYSSNWVSNKCDRSSEIYLTADVIPPSTIME